MMIMSVIIVIVVVMIVVMVEFINDTTIARVHG